MSANLHEQTFFNWNGQLIHSFHILSGLSALCSPRHRPSEPVGERGVITRSTRGPCERARIASLWMTLWTDSFPNSNGDFIWLSVGCKGRRLTRVSANSELSTFRRLRGAKIERVQPVWEMRRAMWERSAFWLSDPLARSAWFPTSACWHPSRPGVLHW